MQAFCHVALLFALTPMAVRAQAPDATALVPARLVQLVHAPEVQAELELTPRQRAALEEALVEVDAVWLRSRNLPPDKLRATMVGLESQVRDWGPRNLSHAQVRRLDQIERQAQGIRMMLRDDLATELELTPEQFEGFISRARTTEAAREASAGEKATEDQRAHAAATAAAEQQAITMALTAQQHDALWKSLGKPFDTAKLTRIYPLAPEIVSADTWINSRPLTLASLRGKVVVVHFYAFQCSNCHANFATYRRWHDGLAKRGVVILGIQTPETPSERDPNLVKAAAMDRELKFPILLDLDGRNWAAWGNTMWPCVYVVDTNGYIRSWWAGELNWQGATGDKTIEEAIDVALAEAEPGEDS